MNFLLCVVGVVVFRQMPNAATMKITGTSCVREDFFLVHEHRREHSLCGDLHPRIGPRRPQASHAIYKG